MCDLYRLLDTVRAAERVLPEVRGLAELMWRYSQGVTLSADDLSRLDGIIDALRSRGAFSGTGTFVLPERIPWQTRTSS